MKTNKLLTLATAAAILVGGLISALAQNPSDSAAGPGPGPGQILQRIAKKLNLTDDQQAQIKAVLIADKGTLAGLFGQLHEARRNLREAIHAGDANEAAVRAASAKVASVEADFAVERMKLYGKIAPILTDEQRRKIADFEQRLDSLVGGAIARLGEPSGD
ncbi:MAG: Spy/CpxP family protein refolding chaperone [Verrucomicrobiia bacterium]